ncbi:virulence factor [Burkholderia glumae]|uniref:virulence factor n=1 Tax=Burkholderia glumae TaxID=337 RepID=UPI002036FA6F|nr:virulence factor [Burkholderia glumae]MCM2539251.1 virulence factor [Burkholderia glumae]
MGTFESALHKMLDVELPPTLPTGKTTMYAIAFDLDTAALQQNYHNQSWQNAYATIGNILARHGFNRQQGSVYFGNLGVDAVKCVLAVQDLSRQLPWFKPSVSDIRMLRIEELNDLSIAL